MNNHVTRKRSQAITLVEVAVVLAITAVLLVLLLTFVAGRPRLATRITCLNNLKQVGLAARMWSNDHNDRFPWMVATNEGGTKEFRASPEVFRHFVVMSNELASPKVLCCPTDSGRIRAISFALGGALANKNISYIVGLDADERIRERFLSGDRNLTGGTTNGTLLVYSTNSIPGWDTNLHNLQGNIAYSDGSVQQLTNAGLARQVQAALATLTNATELRLAIPRVAGE